MNTLLNWTLSRETMSSGVGGMTSSPGLKTFFMLNLSEHECYHTNKC